MDVLKNICSDDCMEVCVHKVEDKVNIAVIFSSDNVLKSNNVLMAGKLLQEDDFSESSLCVRRILKCVEILFKRHYLFRSLVNCFPNYTICSFA